MLSAFRLALCILSCCPIAPVPKNGGKPKISHWFRANKPNEEQTKIIRNSWNRGTPKSSIFMGFSIINHPKFGVPPWLWKPHFFVRNIMESWGLPSWKAISSWWFQFGKPLPQSHIKVDDLGVPLFQETTIWKGHHGKPCLGAFSGGRLPLVGGLWPQQWRGAALCCSAWAFWARAAAHATWCGSLVPEFRATRKMPVSWWFHGILWDLPSGND